MQTYKVTITTEYRVLADSEESAEYVAINRLKEDLPINDAHLDITVVKGA